VRSADEALAALAGGADLIDVKEPRAGSLGRAADRTVRDAVAAVAGRRPVSAALGELPERPSALPALGLAFVKVGLAGCVGDDWAGALGRLGDQVAAADPGCRLVPVIYADWVQAAAPPPDAVAAFARRCASPALLIDTWKKDGRTLLDWLSTAELARLRDQAGVPLALAGSLGQHQLPQIEAVRPDWLAVRGAVCRGGRDGPVQVERVAALATALARGGG
jgi:uncharacterized protein (UPF0264 family)